LIFVDSSVWIASLRDASSLEARQLSTLLDEDRVALAVPVFLEVLSGAGRSDRAPLRRVLSALPMFYPERETWDRVEKWVAAAGEAGQRFGLLDLLIAAVAAEREGTLWSLDVDFVRMEALEFIGLFKPSLR
jgi:predicted nucleic acid-binding protein